MNNDVVILVSMFRVFTGSIKDVESGVLKLRTSMRIEVHNCGS